MKATNIIVANNGGNTLCLDINKIDGYQVDYEHTSMNIFLNGQVIHVDADNARELVKLRQSIMED